VKVYAGVLVAVLALGAGAVVRAADSAGNYAIWGAGGASCHRFQRSSSEASSKQVFKNYLMGYLTAYNAIVEDTYNGLGGLSLEDALAWLDNYCSLHKLDSFDRAVVDLMISQHESRVRAQGAGAPGWGRRPAPAVAVPTAPGLAGPQ
jgi:hypothetical protein